MTLTLQVLLQWKPSFQTMGLGDASTRDKVWHCWQPARAEDRPLCGRQMAVEVVIYPDGSRRCTTCVARERRRLIDLVYEDTPTDPKNEGFD